jgi:hypothetical protein
VLEADSPCQGVGALCAFATSTRIAVRSVVWDTGSNKSGEGRSDGGGRLLGLASGSSTRLAAVSVGLGRLARS